ncbi:MAG: MBL fold metallo-hydrolase [Planctomycetota bacterium]|nr:MAG: MBL fold metallo-hydrolase [Planctomycetota bacterium]
MAIWTLVITGCGTSHGNPPWGVPELWSSDPRDLRRRSGAALLGPAGQVLLIDCGPDLMQQLRDPFANWDGVGYPEQCICRCDGVLLTHAHADHSHGLNDLRHINRLMGGGGITLYGSAEHLDEVQAMFPYCFGRTNAYYHQGNPVLQTQAVDIGQQYHVGDLPVTPWPVEHGPAGLVLAWGLGDRAGYITDAKTIGAQTRSAMRGKDLLVLNMLQEDPHVSHLNWQECYEVLEDLRPRRAVLTHMGYSVRWQEWQDRLPPGVELAYDGWHDTFEVTL